MPTVADF